ncbi:hypothetical protein cypCar_00000530 [Cyprinus carpio]|nr:hypothetical protein cypCar_00000530 [Cyprinus carpio]
MIKLSRPWAESAPSGPAHSLQIRRGQRRSRPNPAARNQADTSQQPRRKTPGPTLLIQRQEMAAFFRLFDDDLIQDFLWMDCCCKLTDKVMGIVPSHFIWQRERAEHHSGAQRLYQNREEILIPRGPSASPEPCFLCAKTSARPVPRPSSTGTRSSYVPLKASAHKAQASHRPSKMPKAQHSCSCMTKSVHL